MAEEKKATAAKPAASKNKTTAKVTAEPKAEEQTAKPKTKPAKQSAAKKRAVKPTAHATGKQAEQSLETAKPDGQIEVEPAIAAKEQATVEADLATAAQPEVAANELEPSAVAVFLAAAGSKAKSWAGVANQKSKALAASAKAKYRAFQDERADKKPVTEASAAGNGAEQPAAKANKAGKNVPAKKSEHKTASAVPPAAEKVSLKKATAMEEMAMSKADNKLVLDEQDAITIRANVVLYAVRVAGLLVVLYFAAIALSFLPQDLLAAAAEKMPTYYGLAMLLHKLLLFAIVLIIVTQIAAMFNTIQVFKHHIVIKKYFFWERHFNVKDVQDIRWVKRIYYAGFIIPVQPYYEAVLISQDKAYHLPAMRYIGMTKALSAFDDAWLDYKMNRALNKIADNKQLSFSDSLSVTERGINCEGTLVLWQEVADIKVVKSEVIVEVKNQTIIYRNFIDRIRDVSLLIMLSEYFTA